MRQPRDDEAAQPELPGTDQAAPTFCAMHPRTETYLRCGRCDTAICPKCLVMTPVGARCKACANVRKLPVFEVRPIHYARAVPAAVGVAALGAIALAIIPGLGFFELLLVLALGYGVGEAASAAANRKRGRGLAGAVALAVPVGIVIGRAVMLTVATGGRLDPGSALSLAANSLLSPLWGVLAILAAMAIAFGRVR